MMLRTLLAVYALLQGTHVFAFPELDRADVDVPAGFQVMGNSSQNAIVGQESLSDLLLGKRQTCAAGYNNCAYTGECCPLNAGNTCCGRFCIGLQPAGTNCCQGYMCPPSWKCCGQVNGCYPEGGACCTASGIYCPPEWGCCGNRGYCYPTKDFQCCSNDGTFCPKNTKCVYCRGSTTRICCLGADNREIPVFQTNAPAGNGGGNLDIPDPTTIQPAAEPTTTSRTTTTSSRRTTTSVQAVEEYYTTTFVYTYLWWTRVVTTITSTTSTVTTIYSVLASNSYAASNSLRIMASSIQSSAIRSARLESPTASVARPTETATSGVGNGVGNGGGGGSGGGASAASGFYVNSGFTLALISVAIFLLLA